MIKAVVWDWGGVLMRTEDRGPRHRWDARLDIPEGSVESVVHGIPEWRAAQFGAIGLDAYWEAVRAELGLDPDSARQLRVDFYSGDRLDAGLVSSIRQKQGHGLRNGLLSNNTLDMEETLDFLKLRGLFDAVVISAQIRVMKPDPAAYHAILDALGVAPVEAVMIDDFEENIRGAQAVGMKGILFRANGGWQAELDALLQIG